MRFFFGVSAKTQNANESLHGCICRKCPQDIFASKKRIKLAVTAAVSEQNIGYVESPKLNATEPTDNSLTVAQKRAVITKKKKLKSSKQYKKKREILKNIKRLL